MTEAADEQHQSPVPSEILEAAKQAGIDPSQIQATFLQVAAAFWSAPLPPPNLLADYNKAYPDCAKDIVKMAQQQSTHRQEIEKRVIEADIKRASRGQIFGLIVAMTVVVVGGVLLWHGRSVTGLVTLITGLTGLVGVFVYARRREGRDLAEKRRDLAGPPSAQLGPGRPADR